MAVEIDIEGLFGKVPEGVLTQGGQALIDSEEDIGPSTSEIVELAALDNIFYGQAFFKRTVRQVSPSFHTDIWNLLEDSTHRYTAIEIFRGGAKTSILRLYTSKRIAYGISRTILFVSASQDHSKKSLGWLRRQIEYNHKWTQTYGLRRGKKWSDEHIEIINEPLSTPEDPFVITILAVGITGQTRGVNIDDYRPDLIVVDDPCDEENTATPEQRSKTENLFFGALQNSLAPTSECPEAKMALLQTSLQREDLINQCHKDSRWASRKYSIFNEDSQSRWPERWSTETLLAEKQGFIDRNQLLLWLREFECTPGDAETADFKASWLQYWDVLPEGMVTYMGIDPVPPPSPKQIQQGLAKKDFEALYVIGVCKGNFYILDHGRKRGHEPDWTISKFFELLDRWRCLKVRVEGVGYQRTLKWILEKAMSARKRYVQIEVSDDKRKKRHRILQAFSGIASQGKLYIRKDMVDFIEQFTTFPNCSNDDDLDAAAFGIECAINVGADVIEGQYDILEEDDYKPIENWRHSP